MALQLARVAQAIGTSVVCVLLLSATASSQGLPRKWGEVTWTHLNSEAGDLEAPFGDGAEMTDAQVFEIDSNGADDIVVVNRNLSPSVVWYRSSGGSWDRYVIEAIPFPLEAGGAHHDVDGDGDIDLVVGEGAGGDGIYWWENPHPNHDPNTPWNRHIIKNSGLNKHHDVLFGDVDADGEAEFVFWNSEKVLFVAEIPADPTIGPWPATNIFWDFGLPDHNEGLAIVDLDLDGDNEIVGGGRWFELTASGWIPHEIDLDFEFSRTAVGQLVEGGRPEILFVVGDVAPHHDGQSWLTMFEWDGLAWVGTPLLPEITHAGHSLEIADFNKDGLLDIFLGEMILGGNDDAKGQVLYGDGTGDFTVQEFSVGIEHHQSKVGDLDGDGDMDILGKPFMDGSPHLNVWINSAIDPGVLALDDWVRHPIDDDQPWLASHVLHGDFDLDGRRDIVSGGWLYTNGSEDFSTPWARSLIGAPLHNVCYVDDFDGDGDLDVLGTDGLSQPPTHPGSTNLYWARNEGDGTFTVLGNIMPGVATDQGQAFVQGILPVDLVGDGTLQIAISWNFGEFGQSGIDLLTVPADPSTTTWPLTTISPVSEGEEIAFGDLDGDGDLDLFQGSGWLRNEGSSWTRFDSTTLIANNTPYDDPDRVSLADLDGDGDLDAVIGLLFEAVATPTDVVWLENPADPTGVWPLHVIGTGVGGGFSMSVADVDNDGDTDVCLGEHVGDTRLLIFENVDGATSWVEHVVDDGAGVDIDHHDGAILVDWENDGDLDVLSVGWTHNKVWLYENQVLQPGDLNDVSPPTVPTDLVAAPYASTRVDLTWSASTDDRGVFLYRVLRDGVEVGTTAGLAYQDSGLAPSTTYVYSLVATDLAGNASAESDVAAATTPTPDLVPPTAPSGLAAEANANWVELSWGRATDDRGVVGYTLRRDGVLLVELEPDEVFHRDETVTPGTSYLYELVAYDADGNGSAPATVALTTLPTPTGLWLGYSFDDSGSSVVADASIYGNDGILAAPGAIVPGGYSGDALEVNGIAGHVDLQSLDVPTDGLSILAWIQADDFDVVDARIISKSTSSATNNHVWMLSTIGGPTVRFRLKTDDDQNVTTLIGSGGTLGAGQWHHVAATYDGAFMRLYIDGSLVGTTAKTGAVFQASHVPAYVGANPGDSGQVFDGRIDELKIFGRGLTAAEVAFEMNTPVVPPVADTTPPTAPGSLTATATSAATIALSWTAASDDVGLAGYAIDRDGAPLTTVSADALGFVDTGLTASTTHSYTVVAVDTSGNTSPAAGPAVATTSTPDTTPPTPPSALTGVAVGPTSVSLSWGPANDDVGLAFLVVRRDGLEVATLADAATSYLDLGALPNTTHLYEVTAVDLAGNEASAGPVPVTTPPLPPPPPMPDLVLAYGFDPAGASVLDVSGNGWDGVLTGTAAIVPTGVFGSAVSFDGSSSASVDLGNLDIAGDALTIAAWVLADDFGTKDARIVSKASGTAADDHWWMLSTINSQRLRFRLKTDDGNPTTTLIGAGGSLVAGQWHFVAATYDGAQMRLFLDGVLVGSTPKTGDLAQSPSVAAAIGANPGGVKLFDGRIDELRLYARALDATELDALALEPVMAPVPDTTPPGAPGSVAAVATSDTTVDVSWTPATDDVAVTTYEVTRGGVTVATLSASALAYTDTGLTPATAYDYAVRALDAAGNVGPAAGPVSVTTANADVTPPTPVGALTAVATSPTSVDLTWTPATDDVGLAFLVVRRDGVEVTSLAGTAAGYTDGSALPDTTHAYEVTAVDLSGNQASAGPVSVTTPPLPPPPDVPNLWAAYSFSGAGQTVLDLSGNGHDGVLTGSASVTPLGYFGDGVEFDGSTSASVDLGNLDIPGDQLTIAAWVRADDFGTRDARILSKATGIQTDDHLWMLSTITGQRLRFRLKTDDGNGTTTLIGGGGSMVAGQWHFVTATYDGAVMRLYLDGALVGSTAKTGTIAQDPTVGAAIGANPTDEKRFDGRIDELRILTKALSPTEVANLATAPVQ